MQLSLSTEAEATAEVADTGLAAVGTRFRAAVDAASRVEADTHIQAVDTPLVAGAIMLAEAAGVTMAAAEAATTAVVAGTMEAADTTAAAGAEDSI